MRKTGWIFGSFAAMYIAATIIGFSTYLLVGSRTMWISVFTLMPMLSALLIYVYLRIMRFPRERSLTETMHLVLVWVGLSFGFDAVTYVVIIPAASHTIPNWTFFQDQSPWIWLSYAVLVPSAYVGRWMYLRKD
ncbi:MAG: hypothetical protein WAN69_17500 [Candidatus Korobacteraceae bacterium]